SWDRFIRTEYHSSIETGLYVPASTPVKDNTHPKSTHLKWTETLGSKLLLEAGAFYRFYDWTQLPQPEVRGATCFTAFNSCPQGTNYGDIAHRELLTGITTVAWPTSLYQSIPKGTVMGAVSYNTGTHSFKA